MTIALSPDPRTLSDDASARQVFQHFADVLASLTARIAADAAEGVFRPEDLGFLERMAPGLLGAACDLWKAGQFKPEASPEFPISPGAFEELTMLAKHLTSDGKATLNDRDYALDEVQARYVAGCEERGIEPDPRALAERKAGGKPRAKAGRR